MQALGVRQLAASDLASFWRRAAGLALDGAITFVISLPTYLLLDLTTVSPLQWNPLKRADGTVFFATPGPSAITGFVVPLLVALGYAFLVHRRGATFGMEAMGLKCLTKSGRQTLTYGRSCCRHLIPLSAGLVSHFAPLLNVGFLFIYLWMLWDSDRQTLNDKLAKSIVVYLP
jgi:uncharacterized RDD family membrane protein YckC